MKWGLNETNATAINALKLTVGGTGHQSIHPSTYLSMRPCGVTESQDATGQAYSVLGYSNGFEPKLPRGKKVNPYLRLLPMLAGIG